MENNNLVVFFGFSSNVGLCFNFVDFYLEFKKKENLNYILKILTPQSEQTNGLIDLVVEKAGAENIIFDDESLQTLPNVIASYENIILHVQGVKQLIAVNKLKNKLKNKNIKIVYTVHAFRNSFWYGKIYSLCLSFFLNKVCKKTIFLTHNSQKEFCGSSFLHSTCIIPTGVNLSEESLINEFNDDCKFKISGEFKKINIVYLANFYKNKGHFWLLKAIEIVVRNNKNVVFHLLGEGVEFDNIRKQVVKNKLEKNVMMPGRLSRDKIPLYLSKMNCAVVTSASETFGHSFIEPMLFSLPVIGTKVGVGPNVIYDYVTGFLINKFDYKMLAEKIIFLSNNLEICSDLGRGAQSLVFSCFGWEKCVSAHNILYTEIFFEDIN